MPTIRKALPAATNQEYCGFDSMEKNSKDFGISEVTTAARTPNSKCLFYLEVPSCPTSSVSLEVVAHLSKLPSDSGG